MALPPLTHHDILGLIEPFTRRGRRIDLDHSDRAARRLLFKPSDHSDASGATLREELTLEQPYARLYSLTRTLTPAQGPAASLLAEGPDPGALLALIEAIPAEQQLGRGPGFALSHHHQIDASAGGQLVLVHSALQVGGLTLTLRMPHVKRRPAELELRAEAGDAIALPEDLLAVLGWSWSPLQRVEAGSWRSKLRLGGVDPRRSRRAEAQLERAARHLAQTLAEAPRRFHERYLAARYGAMLRRMIPVLTGVLLVVVAVAVPAEYVKSRPVLRVLLMNAPLFLVGLSFTLQEMSRIEIPPWPRPLRTPSWRGAPLAPAAADASGAASAQTP